MQTSRQILLQNKETPTETSCCDFSKLKGGVIRRGKNSSGWGGGGSNQLCYEFLVLAGGGEIATGERRVGSLSKAVSACAEWLFACDGAAEYAGTPSCGSW